MKLVIFGLSISSSWGNGHATLWRGLCRALTSRGHKVVFFERDVPYYAAHRDASDPGSVEMILYSEWADAVPLARKNLLDADVGMVTSYCPDGVAASDLVLSSSVAVRAFYDLDTPVTLEQLMNGKPVAYLGPRGLRDFDFVLSYTGGAALDELRVHLGARRVAPLYGSVDPDSHRPVRSNPRYSAALSYLGTYAEDRQSMLEQFFVEPARRLPQKKFLIGGSLYPWTFPWTGNIFYINHLPPAEHPAFYCSSTVTLNVTRGAMARMGYCPSGRLFEAAACQVPIITDEWEGISEFFEPGREILVARGTEDVINALAMSPDALAKISRAARERCLSDHTAAHRAIELESALDLVYRAA